MVLLPTASGGTNTLSRNQVIAAGKSNKTNDSGVPVANTPFQINCTHNEFACSVTLDLSGEPSFFEAGGNAMLVVSLPYGDIVTDFAVTLRDASGNIIPFENVQISVDSTGRGNQLLRRVESRLDPADIFFPYPQYEVELSGTDEESLLKYFWITANCWTDLGTCANNGRL